MYSYGPPHMAGRPARTYIQQLCEDTGCCPEDLPRAMNDRVEWREGVRDIRATSTTWWWWYESNNVYLSLLLLSKLDCSYQRQLDVSFCLFICLCKFLSSLSLSFSLSLSSLTHTHKHIQTNTHTHTHTHTHTQAIYIYIYIYIQLLSF